MQTVQVTCVHCGKVFSTAMTVNSVEAQLQESRGSPQRYTYTVPCTHCGKPNTVTVNS